MTVTFEDFEKLEIRIGRILSCERIEGTDRLLKLSVDLGGRRIIKKEEQDSKSARNIRQIVSGIAQFYSPEDLVNKQCPFIVNLEPRKFKGVESWGMILAVGVDDKAVLLHPDKEVPEGSKVK